MCLSYRTFSILFLSDNIMDVSISSKCKFLIFILLSIALFCYSSGYAEDTNPSEIIPSAFFCFNKDFIYSSCEEAYRLDQSGFIAVPPYATDQFCSGPCLVETQLVLNCIDNVLSNFIFYNKATIKDIRYALHGGCSFTSLRGNFNVGDYLQGETSNAGLPHNRMNLHIMMFIVGCYFSILYRLWI